MNDKLQALIAKHASEKDVRKRAVSLREDADTLLESLTQDLMASDGLSYEDAYDKATKSDLGSAILRHREEASRLVESQPAQE